MKRNTLYIIPALCLLFSLSSCKEELEMDSSSRQIVVTASLEELHTRVSLDQKAGSLDLIAKWNAKDKISLYIIQGKKGYKLNPVPVQNISSDGKNCDIVFQLPSAVIAESPYDIYGLCDADGEILEEESMVSAKCNLQRLGWNELKTPVWFHAKGGAASLKAYFRHLGTYEILHITNNSKSQCSFVHAGFDVETPWYKSSDLAPLSDSYDPTKMPGEPGDDARMRASIPISSGETASVMSWYIPNGAKVKDARLIAEFGGKRVISENTLSSDARIQVGHAYHMYATWDGEKLVFEKGEEEMPSWLSCPDNKHPHVIDMGKAGKWACCNVGAKAPWEYGGYYAWGETEEKDYYAWNTYKYLDKNSDTFYDIGDDIAGTKYDVAHVKWGSRWQMPSYNQLRLLQNSCSSEFTSVNGINGRKITAPNGFSIFLPAAGDCDEDENGNHNGKYGVYWSSTLNPNNSFSGCSLLINDDGMRWNDGLRYYGFSVRPVFE